MFCKDCGKEINDAAKFCTKCGKKTSTSEPSKKKWLLIIGAVALLITIFLFSRNKSDVTKQRDQDIAAAVVNILCYTDFDPESGGSGGSGTIITADGLILTNSHIIPQTEDSVLVDENDCLVTLPDPDTGAPNEIYTAYPIVIPEISDAYDLAFMQIHDVYYDEEGQAYGEYPKAFPTHADSQHCADEYIQLGEPVRIYGYPTISGGIALTITDGIVSSLLLDEGLIVTSAKISSGNSGGLAVDGNGCRLGIPAMVSSDENESLGIIISNDLIAEFLDELEAMLSNP